LSALRSAFATAWLLKEMSALRSASHLSARENDNVTIHSESGAVQGKGFRFDAHSGLQDPAAPLGTSPFYS